MVFWEAEVVVQGACTHPLLVPAAAEQEEAHCLGGRRDTGGGVAGCGKGPVWVRMGSFSAVSSSVRSTSDAFVCAVGGG